MLSRINGSPGFLKPSIAVECRLVILLFTSSSSAGCGLRATLDKLGSYNTSMHGNSIAGKWRVERKSGRKLLELKGLEGKVGNL
jgi:hypothetical protein